MTRDEILKLKAATLYVIKQCGGEIDFMHLFKILYFAERLHYASYGKHLINDTFHALERGPVPSFLYDCVKVAIGTKTCNADNPMRLISSALTPSGGECQYYYVRSLEDPDMDELSRAALASLDKSIAENLPKSVGQLSSDSHDEAWSEAWNTKHASQMNNLSIARAGGASEEFIKIIKEQEEIDRILAD